MHIHSTVHSTHNVQYFKSSLSLHRSAYSSYPSNHCWQATVNTSCWHKAFVLYMMWWKSPMASHGITLAWTLFFMERSWMPCPSPPLSIYTHSMYICVTYQFKAAIQRRGSKLSWSVILSVYGADTIAIDLSLSALISWFMISVIGFLNKTNLHAIISTLLIINLHRV
jgi:hypothetical protein